MISFKFTVDSGRKRAIDDQLILHEWHHKCMCEAFIYLDLI